MYLTEPSEFLFYFREIAADLLFVKKMVRWVLLGAVSWEHYHSLTDHYSVFARVSHFLNWIKVKMS